MRDIIERIEELESELDQEWEERESTLSFEYALQDAANWPNHKEEYAELQALLALMEDLKGNGGDEQWRGDWYPLTLIRDSYFVDYAQELAEECGYTSGPDGYANPLISCVDWKAWASDVRMDYTSTEIDGVTYWYR